MPPTDSFSIARREIRCDVPTPERLRELLAAPLPLRLRSANAERRFFRDVYLDTADARLRERGVTCRFRASDDDRQRLTVHIDDPKLAADSDAAAARRYDADVRELDALRAVASDTDPARRLRAFVDPGQLRPTLVVTTERVLRRTIPGWFRRSQFDFVYDRRRKRRGRGPASALDILRERRRRAAHGWHRAGPTSRFAARGVDSNADSARPRLRENQRRRLAHA